MVIFRVLLKEPVCHSGISSDTIYKQAIITLSELMKLALYRISVLFTLFFCLITNNSVLIAKENRININNHNLYSPEKLKKELPKFIRNQEFQEAIFILEKLIKLEPNDESHQYNYGLMLYLNKNYEEAKQALLNLFYKSENPEYQRACQKLIRKIDKIPSQPEIKKVTPTCTSKKQNGWGQLDLPLSIYVPQPFFPTLNLNKPEQYQLIVQQAFLKWQEVYPELKLAFTSYPDFADIKVTWYDYFKTTPVWSLSSFMTKERLQANINLAIRTPANTAYYTHEPAYFSLDELEKLAMHEFGHALGLPDNSSSQSIMSDSIHKLQMPVFFKWLPSKEDIEALKKILNREKIEEEDCQSMPLAEQKYVSMIDQQLANYLCYTDNKPNLKDDGKTFFRPYSRWRKQDFPLKVFVPVPKIKNREVKELMLFQNLMLENFKTWEYAVGRLIRFTFVNTETEADITVKWEDYFEHKPYWGATQTYTSTENPHQRLKVIIHMALRAQAGWYSEHPLDFGEKLFAKIARHEIAHALGLDHGPDFLGATGTGDYITPRDIDTLLTLYGIPLDHKILCHL